MFHEQYSEGPYEEGSDGPGDYGVYDPSESEFNALEKYPEWSGAAPAQLREGIRMALELPDNIIDLEDDDESVNLLVYGKSGVGKTVFAGSADNVLFLAPEDDGTLSAKRRGSKAKKWPIRKWEDLEAAYNWLYDNPDHGFDWICIDSATEMQQMLLRAILDAAVAENGQRDLDIPAIQDHQKWQNMFKRFVKAFNALPVNVLWTCLVRNCEDEEKEEFLCPDIQGKGYQLAQAIASYMTSYGYMQVVTRKVRSKKDDEEPKMVKVRQITWEDTGPITGKDRTGNLAPRTVGKSLQQITDMIYGTGTVTAKKSNSQEQEDREA